MSSMAFQWGSGICPYSSDTHLTLQKSVPVSLSTSQMGGMNTLASSTKLGTHSGLCPRAALR